MSRYIDADALDRAFSKLRFNNDGELEHYGDRPNWYLWGSEVENLIADAPSIDLVFCRDCHWSRPRSLPGETGYRCVLYRIWKGENGFCDSGDRKEVE